MKSQNLCMIILQTTYLLIYLKKFRNTNSLTTVDTFIIPIILKKGESLSIVLAACQLQK